MKVITLTSFVLLASLIVHSKADGDNKRGKAHRYYALEEDLDDSDNQLKSMDSDKKVGASSGRLFIKKFFSKKFFGQNQTPQVIPIIITTGGGNTDGADTNIDPTAVDTLTDTPTLAPTTITTTTNTDVAPSTDTGTPVSTPTGADTVDPANPMNPPDPANPTDPVNPPLPGNRIFLYGRGSGEENDQQFNGEATVVDAKTLAAALSAGPEEYVITDQELKDISSAKANRPPTHINLRLRGGNRDQLIRIRLPANYRGYFQNGQRVVPNGNKRKRPVKRRVIRRRRNRRRPNKNKNKRPRFVAG